MTMTYPAKLMPVGDLYAADVDLLNDPVAFAAEVYSSLAGNALECLFPRENPSAIAAFDAARALVRETAAAGGDVDRALNYVSDAAYGMASDAESRGMDLGVAFECFRQALIGALTPRVTHEGNNRSNLEAIERQREQLRGEPAADTAD